MADKMYPVGTKIRYIGACGKCKGQIGEIVALSNSPECYCYINLPKSTCSDMLGVRAFWKDLELFVAKNQQLLFSFMES